ncbi:hypothetical protein HXX76_009646 [Chlamydomonas incerta]|uniref:BACK domain-containing protein n=1 Tax=Chlamydomonas incerta TaxID=51695 RepID=A0A835SSM3_CHLIN|nr:hypothetical protein HXX76_009646 [Chlamydomonas incerta]|eukprot:KAG2431116.1 hypothetical protein HXX76_009646 [Chlamydomonas incerta]
MLPPAANPAAAPGNPDVISSLAGLYGQQEYSDCKVVFMLETTPRGGQAAPSGTLAAGPAEPGLAPGSVVGEPLPAHSLILRRACEKWNQQWLDWTPRPDSNTRASKRRKLTRMQAAAGGGASPAARADVPEIRIAVRSADEVPAAAAVVKLAYTGLVEAGSITEALQVRQQAGYLRMPRCMEACLALVKEALLRGEGASAGAGSSSGAGGGHGGGSGSSSSGAEAAMELFRCSALWPDPANDPTFAAFEALLSEAKRRLVAHFGDALAVLNKEVLRRQLWALPAMGLEALLESDGFGTDSESSVVLVLAVWMYVNHCRTDADTRRRLCGLLRLVQCSRGYLAWVLPALALDHHDHPDGRAGWLPITPDQAGWLSNYVGAAAAVKEVLWEERGGVPEGWLNCRPRRQCVPPPGLAFTFGASREDLAEAFATLEEQQSADVYPEFDDGVFGSIWAMGLEWRPNLQYTQGDANAYMFLCARVPATFEVQSSTVRGLNLLRRPTEMQRAGLYMSKRGAFGRWKDVLISDLASSEAVAFGSGRGNFFALYGAAAPPVPAQRQAGEQQQALRAREAVVAARWAAYLRDGKLTGKVVLLPRE